jgi:DNA replication protein DnaC
MQNEAIRTLLKTLHCNGILTHWEELTDVAALQSMNNLAFLQKLLETEAAYRETRALLYRLDVARLPQVKSLTAFVCQDTPVQPRQLDQLADCQFVRDKQNILLIGGSGSGKTHLALATAYEALQQRYRVKFYVFSDLARQLLQAKAHRYEGNLMSRLLRFQVLVIDELGYLPIEPSASHLLFELFSKLYERVSLIITTHLTFEEWAPLFGSAKASRAIVDRITHHCALIETGNISWRLKEGTATQK